MERDTGSIQSLYDAHRAELYKFLRVRVGDPGDVEDILQELWLKLEDVAPDAVTHGRAYLYKVVQNIVVDRLRERQRRMRRERVWSDDRSNFAPPGSEPIDLGQRNAEEAMLEREETAMLASAIGTLPDGARRVFQLHKIEGLSHAEVALRLGITKSGVEKHMAVAMKYLRRAMMD